MLQEPLRSQLVDLLAAIPPDESLLTVEVHGATWTIARCESPNQVRWTDCKIDILITLLELPQQRRWARPSLMRTMAAVGRIHAVSTFGFCAPDLIRHGLLTNIPRLGYRLTPIGLVFAQAFRDGSRPPVK